ncbi:DUF3325 domain-containing protein [Catenovulum agarivorans]|uniref:DUF3325 domain-containing protein n=1 Tax=Catenovulum agarivorans TaxID=1172192 RepID=UPI0002D68A77|nr:DUF3325 domain-containing protein [Catenovulum agarivorans]
MIFVEIILITAGFVCLALSLSRHYEQIFNKKHRLSQKRMFQLRYAGCSWLALSLYLTISVEGIALGITYWSGLATLVSLVIAMLLTYIAKD